MSRSRGSVLLGRVLQRGATACNCSYSHTLPESSALCISSFSTASARTNPGLPAVLNQFKLEAARCRQVFATRPLSGQADDGRHSAAGSRQQRRAERAVVSQEQTFDEITDKHIPQRPLGVVEGTSYSLVILAAIGFGIAILWTAVSSLLIQPKEYTCFNVTLDKLRDDPRVTVRLGTPISGYGQESRNRAARQRIPHRAYKDDNGTEHIQVQFHAKGPTGAALISADMYQDDAKQWQWAFLYVDMTSPTPQRLILNGPSVPQY
ncbi:hypothetical protein ABBQ32_010533 [Trebouxia sp. C0010 RCD-2024]